MREVADRDYGEEYKTDVLMYTINILLILKPFSLTIISFYLSQERTSMLSIKWKDANDPLLIVSEEMSFNGRKMKFLYLNLILKKSLE